MDASAIKLPVCGRVACGHTGYTGLDHGLFAANIAANNP
jgi:hypothetical protein